MREAYATLREQWRLVFEIGARNRRRGVQPAGLRELLGLLQRHAAARKGHPRS